MKSRLTEKEKLVLYGLIRYPELKDGKLAEKIGLKHSTVTSIRLRLRKTDYYRCVRIPMLQNLGCEMLVIIYTSFNPVIPLEERVVTTGKTIEVFEEIFYSIGEQEQGFSLSLSQDYTAIGKINDIRTQTFGKLGLLENEYPVEVVFPIEISKVHRFFNFAPLLKQRFGIARKDGSKEINALTKNQATSKLTDTEQRTYCALIEHPEDNDSIIAQQLGISRHTVSRMKKRFRHDGNIKEMRIPNLRQLGFEILAFYHIRYDPSNPPDIEKNEIMPLKNRSTIFMASRQFETVMISIYSNYDEYRIDKTKKIQFLKEKNWLAENPIIRMYSLNKLIVIKDFTFVPITKKVLGLV